MSLKKIMNERVVVVDPCESILKAAEIMSAEHVGDLIVVEWCGEKKRPIGIITDRDIVIHVVAKQRSPSAMQVVDLMMHDPVVLNEHDGLFRAMEKLRQSHVRCAPVTDDKGNLVGVISMDDFNDLLSKESVLQSNIPSPSGWQGKVSSPSTEIDLN